MEHGLENRFAILQISSNILKYRISKNMKRTQIKRMNSMVQFLCFRVLSSPPISRLLVHNRHSLTPMGKITSFPISRNMPCSYMNHMSLGQFYDRLPVLQTSCGFTIQCLSSKTSATFTNMEFPPSVTVVFVDVLFSGWKAISGKTSNSSQVCACDSTSQGRSASHISDKLLIKDG